MDRLFLFFSIIEGFKGNSYPHQTNLQEYSARAIDEWQREEEKGRKEIVLTCLDEKVEMYKKFGFVDLGMSDSVWGGEEWHEMTYYLR